VRALVDHCSADKRLLLMVLLMLQEGLRRVEVSRLNVEDIDFTERSLLVKGKNGQGRVTAALPISDETWRTLTAYLAEAGHRNGPLLRNLVRGHGRLAPSTVSELVREAMRACGVKGERDLHLTPHSLRHTMGHDLLTHTNNVRSVQRAMRHASVRSTEVYLRGHVGEELRQIMGGRTYLHQLDELHEAGVLTAEEYAAAKARVGEAVPSEGAQ
jgi:integrase